MEKFSQKQRSEMAKELGRAGGLKNIKKWGKKRMREIAQNRWSKVKNEKQND